MKDITARLKQQGARLTQVRRLLIDLFGRQRLPLSEPEIRARLAQRGRGANKSTVYRELEYLRAQNIIKGVDFGDGKKRFELNASHHHHLICDRCRRVEDIHLAHDVNALERKIAKNKQFKILSHSLEFFGLCARCQL